jgi:hypothetical protein
MALRNFRLLEIPALGKVWGAFASPHAAERVGKGHESREEGREEGRTPMNGGREEWRKGGHP